MNPRITETLTAQIKRLPTLHGSFNNDIRAETSMALIKRVGGSYSKGYWSCSGTESVEAALKFAALKTGKKEFIVCSNAYHGKTLGALSATQISHYRKPFEPLVWTFKTVPFDDSKAVAEAITDQTAGFLVEPIQGDGGVYVPRSNFLSESAEICRDKGILFIMDEVQVGCGRTGKFLASEGAQ